MVDSVKCLRAALKFHQAIGIYPCQSYQNIISAKAMRAIFLICFAQFIFTAAAFLAIEAQSMFNRGFGYCILIALVHNSVIYLIFIWKSTSTMEFFENCDGFIEKRIHSSATYNVLTGNIELIYKFLSFAMGSTITIVYLLNGPYTFVRYYIFNMGANSYFLFGPCWYPFDWKTPSGYLMAWLSQGVGIVPIAMVVVQILSLVFGSSWLFIRIAEDIAQDVTGFNNIVTTTTDDNRTELIKRFCDLVQIYTDAKQCVMKFNETLKYGLFVFFSWNLFGMAAILVTIQFQLWDDESTPFEIGLMCSILIWSIVFIFLPCEPGETMINQFEKFGDELSQCDWYVLSVGMQRMYMTFLSDAQNPIKLSSFADIPCERETIKRIINGAFSYFMTFRRFRT